MPEKIHDIVLYGATGFTGQLVAEYFAEHVPHEEVRWALAGRSLDKLRALKERLMVRAPHLENLELIVANARDRESLQTMARHARVVVSTVGPYVRYGEPLVEACIEQDAHYVDITGEPEFWEEIVSRYHEEAQHRGLFIVPCCGFDSIPPDLGVLYTLNQLSDEERQGSVTVECFVSARGKASGGTWHSAVQAMANFRQFQRQRKNERNGARARSSSSSPINRLPHYEPRVSRWVAPLPTIDPAVVKRSAREREDYGRGFHYGHFVQVGGLPQLVGLMAGVGAVFALSQFKPTRDYLLKIKEPGDGPSETERKQNWFRLKFCARTPQREVWTQVSGGDPGYGETAKMVAESALCLLFHREDLPSKGGVLTPASAMGEQLIGRLQNAGIEFRTLTA